MKFAKIVFRVAGIWGFLVLTPLYFMFDLRFRPLMIPSVLEKVSWSAAVIVLVLQGRMHQSHLVFAGTDLLLGVLFVIAYFKTSSRPSPSP